MIPVLFKLGPVTVYSFGFFLAVSYVVATFIFWREGKRQGYQEEKLLDISVISLIAALVGGHIYFVLLNWGIFKEDLAQVLYIWQGGFAYWGAFFGVLSVGSYMIRKWKWPFLQVADIASVSISAAIVIGKIGSFLSGVDFGKESTLPWAVTFPNLVGSRHPIQLYEALAFLLIFVSLYLIYFKNLASKNMRSGKVFFTFLISSSLAVGPLEYFRAQSIYLFSLPIATLISLAVAAAAISALYYFQIRDFRSDSRAFLKTFLAVNDKVLKRLRI